MATKSSSYHQSADRDLNERDAQALIHALEAALADARDALAQAKQRGAR